MLIINLAAQSFQCPSNPPRFATLRAASPAMLGTEAEILAQMDALKAQLELSKLEKMNAALSAQIQAAATAPTDAPASIAPDAAQAVQTAIETHGVSFGAITAVAVLATGVLNLGSGTFLKPPAEGTEGPAAAGETSFQEKVEKFVANLAPAPAAAGETSFQDKVEKFVANLAPAPAAAGETSFQDKVENFVGNLFPPADATSAVFKQPLVGGRSAPDIIAAGFGNLLKEPLGWCFGSPSALYSNDGATTAAAVAGNAPWRGMAIAAMEAMPDAAARDPAAFMEEARRAWLAQQGQAVAQTGQSAASAVTQTGQAAASVVISSAASALSSAKAAPSAAPAAAAGSAAGGEGEVAPWRKAAMAAMAAMPQAAAKDPQTFVDEAKKAWLAQQARLFPAAVAPAEPAADSAAWVEGEAAKRAWLAKQQAPAWGPGSAPQPVAAEAAGVANAMSWGLTAVGGGGAAVATAAPAAAATATATATAAVAVAAPSAVVAEAQRMREQLAEAEAELDRAQAAVELARAGAPGAPDYAAAVQRARFAIDKLQQSAIAVKATQAAAAAKPAFAIGGVPPLFDASNPPWRAAAMAAMEAMPEAAARDPQAFVEEAKKAWFAMNPGQSAVGRVMPTALGPRGRSAQEIFWTGVDNLAADPLGWFYGAETSALYSERK